MGLFGKKPDNTGTEDSQGKFNALIKSKELQADILIQSIGDGVIATDSMGRIITINRVAAELTGWMMEEATNIDSRLVIKLIGDEKNMQLISEQDHPFTHVLTTGKSFNQTLILVDRNNQHIYTSMMISPIINPKDTSVIGIVAIIRNVNKERREEQRSADFISTASHEMRTPVAAIEGYLALALNDKVSKIDVKAREYLEKAHASTQHLGQLFQDLLTSARAEDGRLTSHPVVIEMCGFVENLTEDMRFSAEKKGLGIEFIQGTYTASSSSIDASKAIGRTIAPLMYSLIDPDRMREVMTNVFDNAVKYTESGKITISVTGNNDVVQISISDTGPGIPKDDLPHLFQKFYRVDNSATRSVGGTGLGLFICSAIVKLYNGTIWADSKLGEGSTFYINLPRLTSQQAAHLQAQEKPQIT